jgi:hypothetical protein
MMRKESHGEKSTRRIVHAWRVRLNISATRCSYQNNPPAAWKGCQDQATAAHRNWPTVPALVTTNIDEAQNKQAEGYINWLVTNVADMDVKRNRPNPGPPW